MTEEAPENRVSGVIVDAAIKVHRVLGPGLLESVYQVALAHELQSRGLGLRVEVPIDIQYEGLRIENAFKADIVVESLVLIELKSVEKLSPVHFKQTLTYLRLTGLRVGLLINFGAELVRDGIHRVVMGMPR